MKINNFKGTKPQVVNGQRLKYYIAGDPVNVDVDLVYTTTHEEHVAALFQTPAGAEYGKVCITVRKHRETAIKVPYYEFLRNIEILRPKWSRRPAPGGPGAPLARPHPWSRREAAWAPRGPSPTPLWSVNFLFVQKFLLYICPDRSGNVS